MKQLRSAVTLFVFVASAATACATSDDAPPAADGTSDAAPDVVTINPGKGDSSTTPETSTTPKVCVANCKTDSECQGSCPAAPNGGLNCCDVNSGVCYATSGSTCGGVDAGTD